MLSSASAAMAGEQKFKSEGYKRLHSVPSCRRPRRAPGYGVIASCVWHSAQRDSRVIGTEPANSRSGESLSMERRKIGLVKSSFLWIVVAAATVCGHNAHLLPNPSFYFGSESTEHMYLTRGGCGVDIDIFPRYHPPLLVFSFLIYHHSFSLFLIYYFK